MQAGDQQHVLCGVCRTRLVRPPGALQFRCSNCSNVLQLPPHTHTNATATHRSSLPSVDSGLTRGSQGARSTSYTGSYPSGPQPQPPPQPQLPPQPQHVMCPSCRSLLQPPPGADRFSCYGCHQVLLRPGSSLAASAAGLARAGSAGVDQGIAGLRWNRQSEEQRWLRTVDERGKCLKWTRVLDVKEQNQLKAQAEEPVAAVDPEEAYAELSIGDLKYRLKLLGIPSNGCVEKGDLIQCLAGAPSKLNELSVSELKERLNNLGISTDECVEKVDLENRLLVLASNADWLSGRGWVRQLRSNLANTEILWVDAEEYTMQVALPGRSPPSIRDLHKAAALPFESKVSWFREQCAKLRIPWDQGHVVVTVRRDHLIEDSFECFRKLSPDAMHRIFRFSFVGEPAQDAGGVAREWFHELTRGLYNVELGLFEYSAVDNLCYQINPCSGIAHEVHLEYFYFIGRLLGKALFDGQCCQAHMTVPLYKHMLGWPIMVSDLEYVDPQYAKSLTQVLDSDAEMLEALCLDFTVTICEFGEHKEVLLCANGSEQTVDQENRGRYVEKILKYHMFDRVHPQLRELLRGLYEVVPPGLLSVFDYGQLELLLCGLPDIDLQDWKLHTKYAGAYEAKGLEDQVIKWFWEVMELEYGHEQRARLLQFSTGTSRVPVQGFKALQGADGNIKLFTIQSLNLDQSKFPKAHTCFNRIELPMYTSKEQLRKFVTMAIMMENTGFGIE
ncbi:hypothetical protein CYMTET_5577 [Cymbomonas tetramitiformis]|uniref:HECT-type E3 ubiquitin transferase n=1 Tax=Cymbomonas tetramitiformis TaxID=36881 RepID=A0AAE0LIX7_9CHLO|nr:hypothetical protein CYMTET_5577 [Cymbomonas tetramitiformis]